MMKKHLILAFAALAMVGSSCSDDEPAMGSFSGSQQTVVDGKTYSISGFGCGVDITKEIGNSKAQILDLELVMNADGIEVDATQEKVKIIRKGNNYVEMTNNINGALANGCALDFVEMPFGWHLSYSLESKARQLDIYEYGMTMLVNKMYALNVKQDLCSHLKDFIPAATWNEINATEDEDRTDISKIMELYEKYGTHISTQAFYGAAYQYIMFREQNDWESSMESQMKIGMNVNAPIPETGMTISGNNEASTSNADIECYKYSTKEEIERRIGGNANIVDMNEWFNSCTPDNPDSCAFLGYSLCPGDTDNGGLVALYDLFEDGDPRRKAMQDALVKYVEAHGVILTSSELVVIDAFGKHFADGDAPEYLYQDYNGKSLKYYRLDEEISRHVRGVTKGKFHFYYSLGYLIDNAVVDMKFADSGDIDGDWKVRGDHANVGVTGDVRNRYLCTKTMEFSDDVPSSEFVTGFGVKVDGAIKSISKGTMENFNWMQNGDSWYKGLVHDDVYCIYTKDKLKDFFRY